MTDLTIVTYHYVRDLARSRYPAIKGRRLSEFQAQLDHIGRTYTVVTAEEVMIALREETKLPPKAAWLTFDDGYLDHYINVFPLLHERGWQGSFFPPASTILEGALLDHNKIHFILAGQQDPAPIIEELRRFVAECAEEQRLRPFEHYWRELAKPTRFDSADIIFVKRMLQYALPEKVRKELVDRLFHRIVSVDPAAFAAELYMSADQLRTMVRCGMYVGSHGYNHEWLDRLTVEQQAADVDRSLEFLRSLGVPTNRWVMCYPYGAYNDTLLEVLNSRRCAAALTTKGGVACIAEDAALTLPRVDTNDLPIC